MLLRKIILILLFSIQLFAQLNWDEKTLPESTYGINKVVENRFGDIIIGFYNQTPSGIYKSTNLGNTWIDIGNNIDRTHELKVVNIIDFEISNDGNNIYLLLSHGVFVMDANGQNNRSLNFPNSSTLYDLYLDKSNNIYIAANYGLFKYSNSSGQWNELGNFDGIDVHSVVIDSKGYIYSATSNGIYRSTDQGLSWEQKNNGLKYVSSSWDKIKINRLDEIYISEQYLHRLFYSLDNAENWKSTSYLDKRIYDFTFDCENSIYTSAYDKVMKLSDYGSKIEVLGQGFYPSVSIILHHSSGYFFTATHSFDYGSHLYKSTSIDKQAGRLNIISDHPTSDIDIQVSLLDKFYNSNGTTPFNRVYCYGTQISLTTPEEVDGVNFSGWYIGNELVEQSKTLVVNIMEDTQILASYNSKYKLRITNNEIAVNRYWPSKVKFNEDQTSYNLPIDTSFDKNSTVRIKAFTYNWEFDSYSGSESGNTYPIEIFMDSDKEIQVNFKKPGVANDFDIVRSEFIVSDPINEGNTEPRLDVIYENNLLVSWIHESNLSDDIYFKILNSTGNKLQEVKKVNEESLRNISSFNYSISTDGKLVFVWQNKTNNNIMIKVFDKNFNTIQNSIPIFEENVQYSGIYHNPKVEFINNNKFIVCTSMILNNETHSYLRSYDLSINELGSIKVIDDPYISSLPNICSNNNDGIIVIWTRKEEYRNVYMQLFDSNLNQLQEPQKVFDLESFNAELNDNSTIMASENGDFYVFHAGSDGEVFEGTFLWSQKFSATGQKTSNSEKVWNQSGDLIYRNVEADLNSNGDLYIVADNGYGACSFLKVNNKEGILLSQEKMRISEINDPKITRLNPDIAIIGNKVYCAWWGSDQNIYMNFFNSKIEDSKPGLVAYYPFNGNANDESGNGNDGTNYGASFAVDRFGNPDNASSFDGEDDYIVMNSFLNPGSKSVSFWINPVNITNGFIIDSRENEYGQLGIYLDNGEIKFCHYPGTNAEVIKTTVENGEWTHIVCLYDEDNSTIQLYKNGVLADSTNEGNIGDITQYGFKLGARYTNANFYNGSIDDIKVFDIILSENMIRELYDEVVKVEKVGDELTSGYNLLQNYPNPYNPETEIVYSIPTNNRVIIKVFDLLGNEIRILENEDRNAGTYKVKFDGSNLSSGIYLYRISAGSFSQTKKMILLK